MDPVEAFRKSKEPIVSLAVSHDIWAEPPHPNVTSGGLFVSSFFNLFIYTFDFVPFIDFIMWVIEVESCCLIEKMYRRDPLSCGCDRCQAEECGWNPFFGALSCSKIDSKSTSEGNDSNPGILLRDNSRRAPKHAPSSIVSFTPSGRPAVKIPHAGQSYRPDSKVHDKLLSHVARRGIFILMNLFFHNQDYTTDFLFFVCFSLTLFRSLPVFLLLVPLFMMMI